jgi:hypothetical protein
MRMIVDCGQTPTERMAEIVEKEQNEYVKGTACYILGTSLT